MLWCGHRMPIGQKLIFHAYKASLGVLASSDENPERRQINPWTHLTAGPIASLHSGSLARSALFTSNPLRKISAIGQAQSPFNIPAAKHQRSRQRPMAAPASYGRKQRLFWVVEGQAFGHEGIVPSRLDNPDTLIRPSV